MIHSLGDPELMAYLHDYEVVSDAKGGSITKYGQHGWKSGLIRVGRRTINDPERSRRVIRMIFANWLAYADLPPSQRPAKVLVGTAQRPLNGSADAILSDLFVVGADAPTQAKALPPEKLARWFASTLDARLALPAFMSYDRAILGESSARDAMLFALANELFKREHGGYPEKYEELVGPYLKELPPGYAPSK